MEQAVVEPAVARARPPAAPALMPARWVPTAKDVPGERWVGLIERDWPCFVAEGEEVRTIADVLAAVAADSPRAARARSGVRA